MKIKAAVWNGSKSRIISMETFKDVEELKDFMKVINELDEKATYNIIEVNK